MRFIAITKRIKNWCWTDLNPTASSIFVVILDIFFGMIAWFTSTHMAHTHTHNFWTVCGNCMTHNAWLAWASSFVLHFFFTWARVRVRVDCVQYKKNCFVWACVCVCVSQSILSSFDSSMHEQIYLLYSYLLSSGLDHFFFLPFFYIGVQQQRTYVTISVVDIATTTVLMCARANNKQPIMYVLCVCACYVY